jgi:hypothetical protein
MGLQQTISRYPALSEKYALGNWLTVKHEGWQLVGSGSAYSDCGTWRYRGCLNIAAHNVNRLDGIQVAGRVYIQRYRRNCLRASCTTCYEGWTGKETRKATYRFNQYVTKGRAIHITLSPDPNTCKSFKELKKIARNLLKKAGIVGGLMIFHPFRQDIDKLWYWSPHFHVMGHGWVKNTDQIFYKTGWIIKNIGVRKSISSTIFYQLSHCGIHQSNHALTWFGTMSYNQLKLSPIQPEKHLCLICQQELIQVSQKVPEMEQYGVKWLTNEGFFDPDNWVALHDIY